MKKNRVLLLSSLCLIIFLFISCSKDDNNNTNQTKTEILASKKWKPVSFKLGGQDVTNDFLEECDKDDYAVFTAAGIYEIHGGSNKCDPSDLEILDSGSWSFSANETIFTFAGEDYTIVTFTSSTIVLKTDFLGQDLVETFQAF